MVERRLITGFIVVLLALNSPGLLAQVGNSTGTALSESLQASGLVTQTGWMYAQKAVEVKSEEEGSSGNNHGEPFFQSFLIPGWGQLTKGDRYKGYAFLTAEVALIASIIAWKKYSGWLEDDYQAFAMQHADVTDSKDHQFYVDIGNWQNRELYNEKRLRDRRFEELYFGEDNSWNWDNEENRLHFKSLRISSDRASQKAVISVGVLILNHLFSAIDASAGKKSSVRSSLNLKPTTTGEIALRFNFQM